MQRFWTIAATLALTAGPGLGAQPPTPHPRPVALVAQPSATLVAEVKLVPFHRGILGMKGLSPKLRSIRTRMIHHRAVSYRDLQTLADAGDGLAAMFLAHRIQSAGDPRSMSSAVLYYSIAAYDGRASATKPLVSLLGSIGGGLKPSLLKQARLGLEAQAQHRNPDAVRALARFYGDQPIFGSDPGQVKSYLAASAANGSAQAAIDLAVLLADNGTPPEPDRLEAIKYLGLAKRFGDVGTIAIADNLIRLLDPSASISSEASP